MVEIKEKKRCSGCAACYSICPKKCISMIEDEEGFVYPFISKGSCIDCKLCEKICPVINENITRLPQHIYGICNCSEEVRMKSSSGGVFSLLAEYVLRQNGVVFGAKFDERYNVVHGFVEEIKDLDVLRRSKYVQSEIGDCYNQVKRFLNEERIVLFTGTPCQIAGLLSFLRNKSYENLITMDFVCHGVPSPKVWRKYLGEIYARKGVAGKNTVFQSLKDTPVIKGVNFRDKTMGWKKYSFSLEVAEATAEGDKIQFFRSCNSDNLYMKFFLSDTISRPSCHSCSFKKGKSGADITVGDYWWINEIKPEFDDDKGCSVVYVFTEKGLSIINQIKDKCNIIQTDTPEEIKRAYLLEGAFAESASPNKTRKRFFEELDNRRLSELRPLSVRVRTKKEKMFSSLKDMARTIGIFNMAKQIYKKLK